MAKHKRLYRVDDLDGQELPAGPSIRFSLGTVAYEIDLSDANEAALEDALAPFISAARRVRRVRKPRRPRESGSTRAESGGGEEA